MNRILAILFLSELAAAGQPTQLWVNVGTTANDGSGDTIRTAYQKLNTNIFNLWNFGFTNSLPSISTNGVYMGAATNWNFVAGLTGSVANGIARLGVSSSGSGQGVDGSQNTNLSYQIGANATNYTLNTSNFLQSSINSLQTAAEGLTNISNGKVDKLNGVATNLGHYTAIFNNSFRFPNASDGNAVVLTNESGGIRFVSDAAFPSLRINTEEGWIASPQGFITNLTVSGTLTAPTLGLKVDELNGVATNLTVYTGSPGLTVHQLPGAGTNAFQVLNTNGATTFFVTSNDVVTASNVLVRGSQTNSGTLVLNVLQGGYALASGSSDKSITESTATSAELSYLGGVTSPVQTQLGTKVETNHNTALGTNFITHVADIGTPDGADRIPIVDVSTATRKYVLASELLGGSGSTQMVAAAVGNLTTTNTMPVSIGTNITVGTASEIAVTLWTNASFQFVFTGTPLLGQVCTLSVSNHAASTIYATNVAGILDRGLIPASVITTITIPENSVQTIRMQYLTNFNAGTGRWEWLREPQAVLVTGTGSKMETNSAGGYITNSVALPFAMLNNTLADSGITITAGETITNYTRSITNLLFANTATGYITNTVASGYFLVNYQLSMSGAADASVGVYTNGVLTHLINAGISGSTRGMSGSGILFVPNGVGVALRQHNNTALGTTTNISLSLSWLK